LSNKKTELKRIYLSPPDVGQLEEEYVMEAIRSNWIAPLGPQVDAFEMEIAEYAGVKYAVALSSGTAALHLALKLCGVRQGDLVYCSSLTFSASANVILYEKAIPVFIDVDRETWTMSPTALQKAFDYSRKIHQIPKAVIAVNLYGQSADYDALAEICKKYDVPIIEDAAESLGACYKNRKSGSLGSLSVFSFNGNKIITTSGGGVLLSDKKEWIDKARFLATQAREKALHYEHKELGYNYRMSNILASIGRAQLRSLDEKVNKRRAIFDQYFDQLAPIHGFNFMPEASYGRSNRWLTVMTLEPKMVKLNRTDLIKILEKDNIEARPVWKPMHLQPLYRSYDYFINNTGKDVSGELFAKGICLPSGSNLTSIDQDRIIQKIKEATLIKD